MKSGTRAGSRLGAIAVIYVVFPGKTGLLIRRRRRRRANITPRAYRFHFEPLSNGRAFFTDIRLFNKTNGVETCTDHGTETISLINVYYCL